jgi:hypothetical protein
MDNATVGRCYLRVCVNGSPSSPMFAPVANWHSRRIHNPPRRNQSRGAAAGCDNTRLYHQNRLIETITRQSEISHWLNA